MTKIIVAKNAGFCSGVKRAFDKTCALLEKKSNVSILGELIHNKTALKYLEECGAKTINSTNEIEKGDIVVVRAHGVPPQLIEEIKAKGGIVADLTCPFVQNIHKIVNEHYENGYKIFIAGDKNHPEVIGINGCANNEAIVFDVLPPENIEFDKACFVFQTTFSVEKSKKIVDFVEKLSKDPFKTVVKFNTICYTTTERQKEALELAQKNDAVVVVGGKNSANSNQLFSIAQKENKNVFFIENVNDLSFDIKEFCSIAILAGASTPQKLLTEVVNTMSETQKNIVEETTKNTEMTDESTSLENTMANAEPEKELTMEDIVSSDKVMGFTSYAPGKRVKVEVISADDKGITVSLGGKKDGFIPKEEACMNEYNAENYKYGDEIEAIIKSQNADSVTLSKKDVDIRKQENEEAEKALNNGVFELVMSEVVKGGLRARMGSYIVFVPASQIKIGYVKNLEDYKGKKLRLVVMPPKAKEGEEEKTPKKSKYIFASQRMVLESEKKEREDAFWNSIYVHDIVVGKVKRFTEIGAFVNVKGHDCLCHISEISWNTISDPATVLTLNESYDFVVLKMDRETGKISLGYKQLQKKPYEIAAEKFPIGTVVKGKIARIKPYGAFVQIDEGVDGLVHVSQIAHNWIKDATEVFQVGQEVEAKIISFDDNRITLSIKDLLPEPEQSTEVESFADGSRPARKSSRIKKFEEGLNETASRKFSRGKKDNSNEPKEWISSANSATLGDLFKDLDLNFDDKKED